MKIVSFEDIQKLKITPQTCYQWVCEMIAGKEHAMLPPKISIKPSERVFCNVMPCIIDYSENYSGVYRGGVKIVTRYPNRKPTLDSKLLLFDADNGAFLALMDANWITAMRTGAVAAHSIKLFAKSGFSTIGMIGLGNTARATLLVLMSIYPNREFRIKIFKYNNQEEDFMKRFAMYSKLRFECMDKADDVIKGSDVVISAATYLSENLCGDDCFEEGVLVVPIHTRGFTNCDLFFDKIYGDDYGHTKNFKYFGKFKFFAEVYDVVSGKSVGRENDQERILVYNIGIAMHDVNFAVHIYQLLQDYHNIDEIYLHDPVEKFWI